MPKCEMNFCMKKNKIIKNTLTNAFYLMRMLCSTWHRHILFLCVVCYVFLMSLSGRNEKKNEEIIWQQTQKKKIIKKKTKKIRIKMVRYMNFDATQ